MQCPGCNSTHLRKNGIKQGKQNYICAVADSLLMPIAVATILIYHAACRKTSLFCI